MCAFLKTRIWKMVNYIIQNAPKLTSDRLTTKARRFVALWWPGAHGTGVPRVPDQPVPPAALTSSLSAASVLWEGPRQQLTFFIFGNAKDHSGSKPTASDTQNGEKTPRGKHETNSKVMLMKPQTLAWAACAHLCSPAPHPSGDMGPPNRALPALLQEGGKTPTTSRWGTRRPPT